MRSFIVLSLILVSCNNHEKSDNAKIQIEKLEKKSSINSSYFLINKFPKINECNFSESTKQRINDYLENVNELNSIKDSSAFNVNDNSKEIIGDYVILAEGDSIISFEFFVKKSGTISSYKPVFLDIYNGALKESHDVVTNVSRNKLREFIERYKDSSNVNINLAAYSDSSSTKLFYAKKGNKLFIYAGNEGEFGGKYKIEVPLDSVTK